MKNSEQWFDYYQNNLQIKRINWNQQPSITNKELQTILSSLQAWQLGETSDGTNLIAASKKYAEKIRDKYYVKAIELFIKEEQKHGNNLGEYLDRINKPRIKKDWGDTLFRKIRHLNTSMELWTLAVITVESAAQIFYQSLKDATNCKLLQEICTDILIDEAAHINFQSERLAVIFFNKQPGLKSLTFYFYYLFYFCTSLVVWYAHKKVFKAGGNNFKKFFYLMSSKFKRNIANLDNRIPAKMIV